MPDGDTIRPVRAGVAPRLFALVREDFDEDDTVGIALPDGAAVTVPTSGRGLGRWIIAESASGRMLSELVWMSPAQ
ncbi:hypothetical protein [Actinomadura sp. 9N215]|uniref:hypothetical protein n=1 Tax=Actinomadura sp. 9N215 TaxID=3375150 RepID=UPI0037B654AF